jgi:hypothetical protein
MILLTFAEAQKSQVELKKENCLTIISADLPKCRIGSRGLEGPIMDVAGRTVTQVNKGGAKNRGSMKISQGFAHARIGPTVSSSSEITKKRGLPFHEEDKGRRGMQPVLHALAHPHRRRSFGITGARRYNITKATSSLANWFFSCALHTPSRRMRRTFSLQHTHSS